MTDRISNFSKIICLLLLSLSILFIAGCSADVTSINGDSSSDGMLPSGNTKIDLDTAKQIVLTDAGVDKNDATFTETEIGYEYGMQVYE